MLPLFVAFLVINTTFKPGEWTFLVTALAFLLPALLTTQWHSRFLLYSIPVISRLGIWFTDYRLLAEILTQVPQHPLKIITVQRLSYDQMLKLAEFARDHFDQIMKTLKDLPDVILLVLRNINTIRSIARGHGDPIDRYKVMARCATDRSFKVKQNNFSARVESYKGRLYFEFRLWWSGLKVWVFNKVIAIFLMFGATTTIGT